MSLNRIDIQRMSFDEGLRRSVELCQHSLLLLIGKNGAGKSRLLAHLARAKEFHARIFLIAYTPYDQFDTRGPEIFKLLARRGRRQPERTLKAAIAGAVNRDEIRLRRIPRILKHCGYEGTIGVKLVLGPRAKSFGASRESEYDRGLLSVLHAIRNAEIATDEPIWLDLDTGVISFNFSSLLPIVIRDEKDLREVGILKDIQLYLRRHGQAISLRDASSGELSLITTFTFLTTALDGNSAIFIDEPENSLHPQWQLDYLELLVDSVGYETPSIAVATHSPLVVSALENIRLNSKVLLLSTDEPEFDTTEKPSLEGILAEAFETLTPRSHFLSTAVADLLESVSRNPAMLQEAERKLEAWRRLSRDEAQQKTLVAAIDLAKEVAANAQLP